MTLATPLAPPPPMLSRHPLTRPPAPVPLNRPLGTVELLFRLARNPLETWGEWHFRQKVVSGTLAWGPTIVVSDPAEIRRVLVEEPDSFPKDRLQMRILSPGLGDGLLTASGEVWRRTRRTLAPLFAPRAVAPLANVMRERTDAAAEALLARAGRTVDVARVTTDLTFDILSATLFSNDIADRSDAFQAAITRYFDTMGRVSPLDLLGAPDWVPRPNRLRAQGALDLFETTVSSILTERRARGPHDPPDLLDRLIAASDPETGAGLTDEEVAANVVTFIAAGHETTANALGWTFYLLGTHPRWREAVEEEAAWEDGDPADWLDAKPATRAVIEEAMRLYPPASMLTREASEACEIGGVAVEKGALVIVAPYVVQRHRLLWDLPDHFRPERFLPGARERIDRFAYLPFGAGPRVCIGARFALVEMAIVVSRLCARLRFEPVTTPEPQVRITLRPGAGIPMRVVARAG